MVVSSLKLTLRELCTQLHRDPILRTVTDTLDITELVLVNRLDFLDTKRGRIRGCALQLRDKRVHVVVIHVGLGDKVRETAGSRTGHLGHQMEQDRVRRNVEGYAESEIARALVKDTVEYLVGAHVKLRE